MSLEINPEAREELERILAIEPAALTEAEQGFLRARRSYLTEEQRTIYAELLRTELEPAEASDESPRSGKGRKSGKASDEV